MWCTLILYMSGGTYSLLSEFLSEIYWEEIAEEIFLSYLMLDLWYEPWLYLLYANTTATFKYEFVNRTK